MPILSYSLRVSPDRHFVNWQQDPFGNHRGPSTTTALAHDLPPFMTFDDGGPVLGAWVAAVPRAPPPVIEFLVDLNRRVRDGVAYSVRMEPGVLTPDETLWRALGSYRRRRQLAEVFEQRQGVCQDFAHVGIACLRSIGLPARYVSGDLETNPAPGRAKLSGVDGSHAWLSVLVPDAGWLDVDPTNDQLVSSRYVVTAYGRDYAALPD